jgi:hypothetical protein
VGGWVCSCGRSVPFHVEFCRCGRSRTVETAGSAPREATTRHGVKVAGVVAAVAVLAFGAYRWFASYRPPEIAGYNAPPSDARPADTHVPLAGAPVPTAASRPIGGPEAGPAHAAPAQDAPAYAPPAHDATATGAAPVAPAGPSPTSPAAAAAEPGPRPATSPLEAPTETPSESDQFRARIAAFRTEYAPLKIRIEQLEREIGTLRETVARSLGAGATAGDAARTRLGAAEKELELARTQLTDVEERARRAGVSYSQLN